MKGNYLFCAIASLLGLLVVYKNPLFFLFLAMIYFLLLKYYKRCSLKKLSIIFITFLMFLYVGYRAEAANTSIIPITASQFKVEFQQNPKIDGDLLQVQARDTRFKEKLLLRYQIQSESEKYALSKESFYDGICMVSGTLSKPSIGKNPNSFDYQNYLQHKEIYWILDTKQNPLQSCVNKSFSLLGAIKQVRFLGTNYLQLHFPSEIASLAAALIFGDKSLISTDLLEGYQQTGIVHILAISGLHISLFIGTCFYIGIRMGLTRQKMNTIILTLLPVYTILTGASPSVVRASLMIFLILIIEKLPARYKITPLDSLSISFILILSYSPLLIFDTGFQLSFSVSLGIILSAPITIRNLHQSLHQLIAISITAQVSALPFLLYHFFELSLIGIAVNLIYIPLFSFFLLPGVYILFVIQLIFNKSPQILIVLFSKIIVLANKLIIFLSTLTFTSFTPGRPNSIQLVFYFLFITSFFVIWESRSYKKKTVRLLVVSITLISFQPLWNFLNPSVEVTMIDVGQGDSILIHFPFGQGDYLIDTGGNIQYEREPWQVRAHPYEVGRDVVTPYLKSRGITKINKLILSHGDMDHIGGALSIVRELEVEQIIMPSVTDPSETELAIVEEAKKEGIQVLKVSSGDHWYISGNLFTVLSPNKNFNGERNRGSIALFGQIGGLNWFFGGDLDQEGEKEIIKKYPQLKVDILKVGHHGSKTSSAKEFIEQTNPKVALISVGAKNRYGHPHQEVVSLMAANNILIYRTDLQGAITYRFFRGKGTFLPYLP